MVQVNRRLRNKNEVLLRTVKLLQDDVNTNLNNKFTNVEIVNSGLEELLANEVLNKSRKTKRVYSSAVKTMAFTVFYYSPRAYQYLRSKFTLPSPSTIRRWLQTINCEPGFQLDVLSSVANRPEPRLYSLVLDSMSIRKRVSLDGSRKKIVGYCDLGNGHYSSQVPATEALVFLLVPLLEHARYPIAYFFVDKVDATIQSQLITQCLELTAEHRINIVNITCDGCPSNITTLNKLGATVPETPWFQHPALDHKVILHVTTVIISLCYLYRFLIL